MESLCKRRVLEGSRISTDFDIFRGVLIFLMIFGQNLGTILQFLDGLGPFPFSMPNIRTG
jgi:fucose 4-O-acetylase-like acetyltransferase